MKKLFVLIFLLAVIMFASDHNCFTIVVGKGASNDGSVLIAHNEDNSIKAFSVNTYKIHWEKSSKKNSYKLKNGTIATSGRNSFAFLWLQMRNSEFSDSYLNEKGVLIVSNHCQSKEKKPKQAKVGIGFMLRRIVAREARSAREGVIIAGSLVDKYGYYATGRTYTIADPREAWIFNVVQGKHWVARRVPDNKVAIIANRYRLNSIFLQDTENFLGSKDIISYASKQKWYNPDTDGEFNFARAYSDPEVLNSKQNILREWRGINMLARRKFKIDTKLPLFFIPNNKLKTEDLFRVLRDHYEGTDQDLTDHYRQGSPNFSNNLTICNKSTRYSLVANLRSHVPPEIANVMWIAYGRPDSNAYSPWYASIKSAPDGYSQGTSQNALNRHFNNPADYFKTNLKYAYYNYSSLSTLVDESYRERIKQTKKKWNNFENYVSKRKKKMEKEFTFLLKRNREIGLNIITNFIHNLEYRKWFLASELLREIK